MIRHLSWKEVLKIDVNQATSQEIRKAARFKGLAYYTRYDDVRTIGSDEIVSETRFLRIYLDVPYAGKDLAKRRRRTVGREPASLVRDATGVES